MRQYSHCVPRCTCLQYADDSIIYRHCKAKYIKSCANILTSELSNMLTWSSSHNLAFNAPKTKATLFTTSQMEQLHGFEQEVVGLKCKDKILKNVNEFKLLGITVDKNLNWEKHIKNTKKNCYAAHNVLRKIKRYTPLPVRKQLASRISLIKTRLLQRILFDIPKYMKQQLQKVQNAAACFVLSKYANINDVISIKWLPIEGRIEYFLAVVGFKPICDKNVPSHLKLTQKVASTLNLRSNNKGVLINVNQ